MSNARPPGAHGAGGAPTASAATRASTRLPLQRPPLPTDLRSDLPPDMTWDLPLRPLGPAEVAVPPAGGADPAQGPGLSEMSRRPFVRPATDDIDFVRVVRRGDLSRRAALVARLGLLLAGACLVAYLLVPLAALLVVIGVAATTSVAAGTLHRHLDGAAVPRLRR